MVETRYLVEDILGEFFFSSFCHDLQNLTGIFCK